MNYNLNLWKMRRIIFFYRNIDLFATFVDRTLL